MLLRVTASQITASSLNEHNDKMQSKYTSCYKSDMSIRPGSWKFTRQNKRRSRRLQTSYRYE
jgi:hypothetical protein